MHTCMPPVAGKDIQFGQERHFLGVFFRQAVKGLGGSLFIYLHPLHVCTEPALSSRPDARLQPCGLEAANQRQSPPISPRHTSPDQDLKTGMRALNAMHPRGSGSHRPGCDFIAPGVAEWPQQRWSADRSPSTSKGRMRPGFRGGNSGSHACSLTFWPSIVAL